MISYFAKFREIQRKFREIRKRKFAEPPKVWLPNWTKSNVPTGVTGLKQFLLSVARKKRDLAILIHVFHVLYMQMHAAHSFEISCDLTWLLQTIYKFMSILYSNSIAKKFKIRVLLRLGQLGLDWCISCLFWRILQYSHWGISYIYLRRFERLQYSVKNVSSEDYMCKLIKHYGNSVANTYILYSMYWCEQIEEAAIRLRGVWWSQNRFFGNFLHILWKFYNFRQLFI